MEVDGVVLAQQQQQPQQPSVPDDECLQPGTGGDS
jgi:hypothetical protein